MSADKRVARSEDERLARRHAETANEKLRESEEKYRALFDSIDEGFCVVEVLFDDRDHAVDYRFLEVNPVFEKQTGISNAVGRRMREIAPAHEEHWFQIYGQIALTGESRRFQNPALALGRFYDVYAFRLGRPEQRQVAILFNDITKRKQAEEALHRSQALSQAVLSSVAATIAVLDREGNIIAVNDAWKRFARENDGAALADSVGVNYLQVCRDARESRDGGSAALNGIQAVLSGTLRHFELEYPCHSPSEQRWFLMSVTPLLGERGGAVVTHTDITARKRNEWALQESEERFRLTIDEAPIGMALVALDGRFVRVNHAFCQIVGYSSTELAGLTFQAITHPDDVDADLSMRDQLARGAIPRYERKKRYIRKDGTIVDVLLSVSILRARDGAPLYYISQIEDITERKHAEEALRVVSAELRQTLHTAGTGLYHCSRDLRYLSANPAYAQWTGLPLDQIVGRPIVEVLGQAAFEVIHPRIERVLSGERVEFEDELNIAGALTCIHVIYTPDRDASGHVAGWVASVADVTVRRRIEEELKNANAFLDAIIEHIPLMLFMKDSQSLRFVRFNRAGEDLLGWSREHMLGKIAYDFWPQAQADFFIEKDRETLNSGRIVDIPEEPIETRHQGVRLLHTKKVPILDAAGHPAYLLGISEDITERKRMEQEQQFLAEASVLLSASLDYEQTLAAVVQLAVQHLADWCVVDVMDEDGRLGRLKVASADPAKAALCALLEQMPPNRDLSNFVQSVSEGGRPVLVEHVTSEWVESFSQTPEHLQALLATEVMSLIAVPLTMRGQPLGVLVFGSSTPSRPYGPDDLRAAAALGDRAAAAIEHARLYRASREAIELRERVLGIVAHDLRNPLAAIRIQTSFLKRRAPEPERRSQKSVDAINSVAIRMDRLIQDLLSAALIEVGELTMQPTRLSTSRVMTEAVDMERPVALSSSVELQLEVEPDIRDLWVDHDRLLQVFENLIGNAIKFTSPGGQITVGAASREDEVLFWIADTGCGISPGDLPQIFDRFWRATDRTGRVSAGLGLHITKGIVEAHGGRIWVESRQGLGTTFFFTMPVVASPGAGKIDSVTPHDHASH